jgi:hypothetical protein
MRGVNWSLERLELTRSKYKAIDLRLFHAEDSWQSLRNVVLDAITRAKAGQDPEADNTGLYLALRDEWLQRWHGFKDDVDSLYLRSEDVFYAGMFSVERCFYYPSLRVAAEQIRTYGGDEKIYSATFVPAEDFWTRLRGRLRDLDRDLPSRGQEVLGTAAGWLGSRPAAIERYPNTLRAVGLLIVAVLAWQAPSILREMAEFVRALRGG